MGLQPQNTARTRLGSGLFGPGGWGRGGVGVKVWAGGVGGGLGSYEQRASRNVSGASQQEGFPFSRQSYGSAGLQAFEPGPAGMDVEST